MINIFRVKLKIKCQPYYFQKIDSAMFIYTRCCNVYEMIIHVHKIKIEVLHNSNNNL